MIRVERTQREIDIFKRRAQQLAAKHEHGTEKIVQTEIVEVRLGAERYGIALNRVREIQTMSRSTVCRVPNAPSHVLGLVNYRGQALPLLRLETFLSAKSDLQYQELSVVIVTQDGNDVGLCFDRIVGVVAVPMSEVDKRQTGNNFLWISRDRVGLLNLDYLLSERNLG